MGSDYFGLFAIRTTDVDVDTIFWRLNLNRITENLKDRLTSNVPLLHALPGMLGKDNHEKQIWIP